MLRSYAARVQNHLRLTLNPVKGRLLRLQWSYQAWQTSLHQMKAGDVQRLMVQRSGRKLLELYKSLGLPTFCWNCCIGCVSSNHGTPHHMDDDIWRPNLCFPFSQKSLKRLKNARSPKNIMLKTRSFPF